MHPDKRRCRKDKNEPYIGKLNSCWDLLICVHLRPSAVSILLLCFALSVSATEPDFAEASAILKQAIADRAFPGCTVAVGTDEKLLWSHAFGFLDYEDTAPVTTETIYDLASCTKVSGTTSVLMRLVGQGKVRINDPISKYLPEFIKLAPTTAEKSTRKKITVEHLLTHSAGLTKWKPFYRSINKYPDLLQAIFKTPLEAEPGSRFAYSDLGMILLGEIASRAGHKPLAELEKELVFAPLGMTNTLRNPPKDFFPRIAPTERLPDTGKILHGVVHDENARAGEGITGHAGLFSTAEDLSKLAGELLRAQDGKSNLFVRAAVAEFTRPRGLPKDSNRGLGWGIVFPKDSDARHCKGALVHTGFTGTSIRIDQDRKYYVILLTNRVHPTRDNDKIDHVRSQLAEAVSRAFGGVTEKAK